jgi:PadR family transcriptional regulator AphA
MGVQLSTTEYAVLGVLSSGPNHGFALAKLLEADTDVGRIFKVHRPLVYRALDRLVEAGYVMPITLEKGNAGPQRLVHRITSRGHRVLEQWLAEPVAHVRDMRIEFLLKLVLLGRSGQSTLALIRAQRDALAPTVESLAGSSTDDPIELWRQNNAAAAGDYLDTLERLYTTPQHTR